MALMLIKPPGSTGPLRVSEAPTAHVDLQATVLDLLGLPYEGPEESMLRRDPAAPRRRRYGMYDVSERFPRGYLSRLDVISIERTLADASGWRHERTIVPPNTRLDARAIDVGTDEATPYLGPGWSTGSNESVNGSELSFAWGMGEQAVLLASLPREAITLMARLAAPPGAGLTSIEIEVDGRVVQRWIAAKTEDYQDYSAAIPPDPARPPVSALTFHFASPLKTDLVVKLDRVVFGPE
jgi:hypothetical protein